MENCKDIWKNLLYTVHYCAKGELEKYENLNDENEQQQQENYNECKKTELFYDRDIDSLIGALMITLLVKYNYQIIKNTPINQIGCEICKKTLFDTNVLYGFLKNLNYLVNSKDRYFFEKYIMIRNLMDSCIRLSHSINCSWKKNQKKNQIDLFTTLKIKSEVKEEICKICKELPSKIQIKLLFDRTLNELNENLFKTEKFLKYDTAKNTTLCKCCFTNFASINIPCGHIFTCDKCHKQIAQRDLCSICRTKIRDRIKLF